MSKVKFWCSLKTLETVGNVSFEQAEPCSHRQFEVMATTKWRSFARNLVSATSLSKCVKRMLGKPVPVKFCAFFEKMSAPFCHFISMLSKRTFKVRGHSGNTFYFFFYKKKFKSIFSKNLKNHIFRQEIDPGPLVSTIPSTMIWTKMSKFRVYRCDLAL